MTYIGSGWWEVALGYFGEWHVNEKSLDVQPQDEKARELAHTLSPGFDELEAALEYPEAIGGYGEVYIEILQDSLLLAYLQGEGLALDSLLSTYDLTIGLAELKDRNQAIPVPRLARYRSRLEREGFKALELGLVSLFNVYAKGAQVTPQQAIEDEELLKQFAEGFKESRASTDDAMSKWSEAIDEEARLLTYMEKRRDKLQSNR